MSKRAKGSDLLGHFEKLKKNLQGQFNRTILPSINKKTAGNILTKGAGGTRMVGQLRKTKFLRNNWNKNLAQFDSDADRNLFEKDKTIFRCLKS